MSEIEITVGGRSFQVACQAGEENFLRAAAQALDHEAQPLLSQLGRLPEARMLLMAGLMVADRTAALEEEVKALKSKLDQSVAQDAAAGGDTAAPAIPETLRISLAEIAARAESLADEMGEFDV